jgi:membrane protein DedA with SNARE-associated domain
MAGSLLDSLGRLSLAVLYLAAFGLAFGEAAFLLDLLVPGEVGLVVVGAAGRQRDAALPLLIGLGATGALAGDSMSWWVGRRWGTSLVHRWGWTRRFVAPSLAKATVTLERRGGPAIFAARWVGALRALVPLVAGAAGVPYRTVLAWDAPAALGWAAVAVSLGWFLGEHVATVVDRWGGYLSIAVVAVLAVYLLRRRAQTRDGSSTDL